MTSQAERSRERNRQVVERRLLARVEAALAPGPPRRRATRPTQAARTRRLEQKARRATVKAGRRPPAADD
jgi:ribosome-associated protein